MKVIEYNSKIYHLKLSIGDYIAIQQLGLIERLSTYPSIVDYLTLCSILMQKYDFDEDALCDFMDYLTDEYDINDFLEELMIDSGIIEDSEDSSESSHKQEESSIEYREEESPATFEEQIRPMLRDCLAYGMNVDTFYSMTIKEIRTFCEGIKERVDAERRDRAMFDYLLANLITTGTGIVLGSKAQYPSYEDYYGEIFGDVESSSEEMVLEGYATDDIGQQTAVYKRKLDANKDLARMELLAIAQQQKVNSLQKELDKKQAEEKQGDE
jgi:hypothetical protein